MTIMNKAKSELTFSYNNYNKPDIREDADADVKRIIRVLLKKKDNPCLGNLAFDLSKYRFSDVDDLAVSLSAEIKNHLSRVMPETIIDEIQVVKIDNKTIGIGISISGETENSKKQYIVKMQQNTLKDVNLKDIIKI